MTKPARANGRWRKLRLAIALVALGAVVVLFISGVAIFAYQMLKA